MRAITDDDRVDAFADWAKTGPETLTFEITKLQLGAIVACLQLALTHPGMQRLSLPIHVRQFVEEAIKQVAVTHPAAAQALRRAWIQ